MFSLVCSLFVYQLCMLFSVAGFCIWPAVAIVLLAGLIYLLVRKNRYDENHFTQKVKVGA